MTALLESEAYADAFSRFEAPGGFLLPDLDDQPAEVILAWAVEYYFPSITVASSMQDTVLLDLALRVEPRLDVFFLDTGFHFKETLETAAAVQRRYGVDLAILRPGPQPASWDVEGYDACCDARKVAPMERYLASRRAWVSGLRREESPTRAQSCAVEWDERRRMVKVNPLVNWTDEMIQAYATEHGILVNPLRTKGYGSIGCAPCTLPGLGREGRWNGTGKLECGVHSLESVR